MRLFFFLIISFWGMVQSDAILAKKKNPVDYASAIMAKGDSCVSVFDFYHAACYYEILNDTLPSNSVVRKLANVYRRLGRYKDCADILDEIVKDSILYDDLRIKYFAYRSLENADSLILYGDSVIKINSFDAEVVNSLAGYCNANNKAEKAMDVCMKYLQGDSTNMLVLRQYAYASYLLGNYNDALKTYSSLEKRGYDNYESSFIMGISFENLNMYSEAYDYLLKAAKYKEFKDYLSLYHLGKASLAIGVCNEGVDFLQQAIGQLLPDSIAMSVLYTEIANGHFCMHNYQEAAKALESSIVYRPDNALSYYNLANMYGACGKKEKEKLYLKLFVEKSVSWKDDEKKLQLLEEARNKLKM